MKLRQSIVNRITACSLSVIRSAALYSAAAGFLLGTGLFETSAEAGTTLSLKALNVERPSAFSSSSSNVTKVFRDGGPSGVALPNGGGFLWDVLSNTGDPIDFRDVPTPYAGPGRDILTFCLQLTENFSFGSTYNPVTVKDLSQAPDAPVALTAAAIGLIKWLWADNYNSIFSQSNEGLRDLYAGAFQLAIWEIEYDGLNAGNITGAVNSTTNKLSTNNKNQTIGSVDLFGLTTSWITTAKNKYNANPNATIPVQLVALVKSGFQDQVVQLEPPPIIIVGNPVPEPASMAIWLAVGAALVVPVARRRRGV